MNRTLTTPRQPDTARRESFPPGGALLSDGPSGNPFAAPARI